MKRPTVPRWAAAAVVVSAALLPACGPGDGLDSSQASALKSRAESFGTRSEGVEKTIRACSELGQAGQEAGFRACLVDAFDSFQGDIDSLGAYVSDLATEARGECRSRLEAWAETLEEVGAGFGRAAADARAGNYEQVTSTIDSAGVEEIQGVGGRAAGACTS